MFRRRASPRVRCHFRCESPQNALHERLDVDALSHRLQLTVAALDDHHRLLLDVYLPMLQLGPGGGEEAFQVVRVSKLAGLHGRQVRPQPVFSWPLKNHAAGQAWLADEKIYSGQLNAMTCCVALGVARG
jgi:hypothetical protein